MYILENYLLNNKFKKNELRMNFGKKILHKK